jgi:transcription elongation GreA/GreB family factor
MIDHRINELGLLRHEAQIVEDILQITVEDSEDARGLYLEDITSRESKTSKQATSGKSAYESRDLQKKVAVLRKLSALSFKPGIIEYPSPDDPTVEIGSRVTITSGVYEDKYDVVTHEIPGFMPTEVLAAITPDRPLWKALLGRTVGDTVIWESDGKDFVGVIDAIDQEAQKIQYAAD